MFARKRKRKDAGGAVMTCHTCEHNAGVRAGKFKNVPFAQTPCAGCELTESSTATQEYDEARADEEGPACEAGESLFDEVEQEERMPVSVLTGLVALLMALPPDTRNLICWRHQKMPYKTIAANLGTTTKAVSTRHQRALEKWPVLQALFPAKAAKQVARGRRRGEPVGGGR